MILEIQPIRRRRKRKRKNNFNLYITFELGTPQHGFAQSQYVIDFNQMQANGIKNNYIESKNLPFCCFCCFTDWNTLSVESFFL